MVLNAVEILKARARLKGAAIRTPLTHSKGLSDACGGEVYLKWENQQRTGAYKFRGAYNKISSLSREEKERGVVTASSGNHALAVSLASSLLDVEATVVVPEKAPRIKIEKLRGLGANLVIKGANFDESLEHCMELAEHTGAVYVPGTEDHKIMAGQGTIALEIMEDLPDVDTVIAPIGGGGLISGVGTWTKTVNPKVRLLGAQSTDARAMYESFKTGSVREIPVVPTIADGLAGQISEMALEHVSRVVDDIVLAEERALRDTIIWILTNERQVIEGSSAVGPALVLNRKINVGSGEKVAIVVTGGNVDMNVLGLRP